MRFEPDLLVAAPDINLHPIRTPGGAHELCASCVRVLTACPASLQDLAKFYRIRMVPMFAFFQVKEGRSSMKQEIKLLLASMFFVLNLPFEVTINAILLASFARILLNLVLGEGASPTRGSFCRFV
jgi:hypothetical protein